MKSPSGNRPPTQLETKVQAHIGGQLRQLYDQMISEPIPDRFTVLLDQLEKQPPERAAGSGKS